MPHQKAVCHNLLSLSSSTTFSTNLSSRHQIFQFLSTLVVAKSDDCLFMMLVINCLCVSASFTTFILLIWTIQGIVSTVICIHISEAFRDIEVIAKLLIGIYNRGQIPDGGNNAFLFLVLHFLSQQSMYDVVYSYAERPTTSQHPPCRCHG